MAFEAFCLHEIVVVKDEKLLVFCHNPFTQYVAEQFCNLTLGPDKWTRIGANTTNEERAKIFRAWADKYSKIRVLFVPIKIAAASMNLQHSCHHVIFLGPCEKGGEFIQALHRVVRLGQKFSVLCLVASINFTFHDCIRGYAARTQVAIILSQWRFNVLDTLREAINKYCESYWMNKQGRDSSAEWFIADRIWNATVGQDKCTRYYANHDCLRAREILSADGYPLLYDANIFDKDAPQYCDVRPASKT